MIRLGLTSITITTTFFSTGMSDICSPMVVLLENEADAYWCFERTMRRLVSNGI